MAEGTAAVGSVALGGECCEPRESGAIASRMSFEMPENLDGRGASDGERESRGREQGGAKGEAAAAAVRACETMCPRHRVPFGTPLKPADGEGREDAYAAFLKEHTSANEAFDDSIARRLRGKHVALFLDYDGTLTPIVNDPDQALLSEEMRDTVRRLARVFPTAIVSGRGRLKVEAFVGLPELYYAGSHGMDIVGPKSGPWSTRGEVGREPDPALAAAMRVVDGRLRAALASIPGAAVEDNKFSITAHFRRCQCDADAERVKEATFLKVAELMANPPVLDAQLRFPLLKVSSGRKVLEVKPMNSWDKGRALRHIVGVLQEESGYDDLFCVYIGDDRTDEDAFAVVDSSWISRAEDAEGAIDGIGVVVSTVAKATCARHSLRDPSEVQKFLARLADFGERDGSAWSAASASS